MFNGERRIGPKMAKVWNWGVRTVNALCPVCRVECGAQELLDNHLKKRHPKFIKPEPIQEGAEQ